MKIDIRADCIICGAEITEARFRTYCSEKCRVQRNNVKWKERQEAWRIANQEKINARYRELRLLKKIKKQNAKLKKL